MIAQRCFPRFRCSQTRGAALVAALSVTLTAVTSLAAAPNAAGGDKGAPSLLGMSIEDLMNVEVVSASKKAEGVKDAPSNITVITAQQIKEWGMRDLRDVMRRVAGYYVVADRDEWCLTARGNVADNDQKYLILIDGHKMNSDENFGPGNIIELPNDLSNVKQIEIIRGPGSVMWGSGGLAGVINVITKNAEDLGDHWLHTSATVGSHDTYKTNFQMGEKVSDDAEWILMGAVVPKAGGAWVEQGASTGFAYLPGGNSSQEPRGYYTTALDRYSPSYMLQLKGRMRNFKINAFAQDSAVFNRQFEVDHGRQNYLTSQKYFVEGTYERTLMEDLDFTWKISSGSNRQEYTPFPSANDDPCQTDLEWMDRYFTTSADISKPVVDGFHLNAGVDYAWSNFGPSHRLNNFDTDNPLANAGSGTLTDNFEQDNNFGAYLMGTAAVNRAKTLKLVLGSRFDYNSERGSEAFTASPRAGAIWQQSDNSTFKLLYNRGFLRPTNFQMRGGNMDSEIMDQVDFIWLKQLGHLNMTATAYWQKLKGFIIILAGQSAFKNAGDYESKGLELELSTPVARLRGFEG